MTKQLPTWEGFTGCVNLDPSHEAPSILGPYKVLAPLIASKGFTLSPSKGTSFLVIVSFMHNISYLT